MITRNHVHFDLRVTQIIGISQMKTGEVRFQAAELGVVEAWVASCEPHSQHVQLTLLPAGDGDSLRERAWPQCLRPSRSRTSGSSRPHPVCSPPSYCEICKERDN